MPLFPLLNAGDALRDAIPDSLSAVRTGNSMRHNTNAKNAYTRPCRALRPALPAFTLCLSLLPLTWAATANAQQPASAKTVPPLAAARPLVLPQIVQDTLPNGMKLVLLEDHTQPALWMRLALPAGSVRDPRDKVGLASMTAQMLVKGTTARSESQIADLIDGLGASLDASAGEDFFSVSANGLSAYGDTLFSLLADVTLRPTFPTEELERTRTQTLSGVTFSLSQPATIANAAINRLIYGAHPYGNLASGTPKTLAAITQDDVKRFHDTYFAPNGATLFLVGDITPAQARAKALAAFGDWAKKDVPPAIAPPAMMAAPTDTARPQITIIDRPGAAQTEVRIGTLTSGYSDPDRIAGSLATAVLGMGQFEGRLTREIRVKRGLTYGAASFFSRNKDAGAFEISTFTKNVSTGEVVKLALEEARKISTEAVPAEELKDRKTFLEGSFAVSVATPTGVLARLVPAVLYGGGPDDLTRYTGRVEAVNGTQVPAIMRALHLNAPYVVLVGDAKAIQKDLQSVGTVRVIPAASVDLQSPTLEGSGKQGTEGGKTPAAGGTGAATPAELAEGKARLAATIKAHGGDAFVNLKTLTFKGKGELTDPTGQLPGPIPIESLTITIASPDKVRADLAAGFLISFGTEGGDKAAWLTAAGMDLPSQPGLGMALNPFGLLRDAYAKNYPTRSLPKASGGESGYAITTPAGTTVRVYTDAATNLASRIAATAKEGEVAVLLGGYKAVQGVQLPGTLKVVQGETTFLNMTFTSTTVNGPVDDTIFAKPKA